VLNKINIGINNALTVILNIPVAKIVQYKVAIHVDKIKTIISTHYLVSVVVSKVHLLIMKLNV